MPEKWNGTAPVHELFGDWQETMIWSCLQGIMGDIYVSEDGNGRPEAAAAILGDFCFLAGKTNGELAAFWPADRKEGFRILVPRSQEWEPVIEERLKGRAKKTVRYAIKKEPQVFDREFLKKAAASAGSGFEIRRIDEELYHRCLGEGWSRDLVALFGSYERYRDLGVGVAALCGGELVSGASSYTRYRDGIEIEIDTKKDFRRRGLAFACGASLILACLDRGLYPSWDAQNPWSAALAEKLGYHFSHEYTAYELGE